MYLVRIGWRTINLEYLIESADSALGAPPSEASPGMLRVSIYPGKAFEVGDDEAETLRLHIADNIKPLPGPKKRKPGRGRQGTARTTGAREVSRPPASAEPHRE